MLSHEDSSMLGTMKILEEDDKGSCYDMASLEKVASLIGLTNARTKQTFGRLYAAVQAGKNSTILRTSARPDQQEVWTAFGRGSTTSNFSYAAGCEAAANLIIDTWIDYPRPGTEQPYTPGPFNGCQNRRRVCEILSQNAQTLLRKLDYVDHVNQNRAWKYTVATLFDKLCW